MITIDVRNKELHEVEILGHMALFTDLRVDKDTIPDGLHCYELRHGDDNSVPAALEENVLVNYFGAVLMADKMELDEKGYIPMTYDDHAYTGEVMTALEYKEKYCDERLNYGLVQKEEAYPAEVVMGTVIGQFNKEIQEAFTTEARKRGYIVEMNHDSGQLLDFSKNHEYFCSLMGTGTFRYPKESAYHYEIHEIMNLYEKIKEIYKHYELAVPLLCQNLTEFHVLSEYGDVLLAAKMHHNGSLEFVTWNYDNDRAGVHHGHYYGADYENAKKGFAIRSGLIPEGQVFQEEELKMIYQNCVYRGRNDGDISFEDENELQNLMEKIETILPNLQERMPEAERHQEHETILEC